MISRILRYFSSKNTINPSGLYKLRPDFHTAKGTSISNDEIRKSHFSLSLPALNIPKKLDDAIIRYLKKFSRSDPRELSKKSDILRNYLWSKKLVSEDEAKKSDDTEKLFDPKELKNTDYIDEVLENFQSIHNVKKGSRSSQILKKKNFDQWSSLNYHDDHTCEIYLIGKMVPNFTVGCRVFYEIRKRAPLFVPKSFFDFGSGIGSLTWSVNTVWPSGCVREHFLVDASREMLKISEYLLKTEQLEPSEKSIPDFIYPGIYLRQFLPSQTLEEDNRFDLVVSGNSLLDVAGRTERQRIVENLWDKTGSFLVLIEQGTRAGFQSLLEARDSLIHLNDPEFSIFSPCPHALSCGKKDEICNFRQKFYKLDLTQDSNEPQNELFSYMIFAKGNWKQKYTNRDSNSPVEVSEPLSRIINFQTGKNTKTCDIDLCQPCGKVQRYQFSKRQTDNNLFKFLSKSQEGDLFPGEFVERTLEIEEK